MKKRVILILFLTLMVFVLAFSEVKTGSSKVENLISMLSDSLQGKSGDVQVPEYFQEVKTEWFSCMVPPNFDIQIREADYSSSIIFGKGDVNYGRIIVGEVEESIPIQELIADSVRKLLKNSENYSVEEYEQLSLRGIISILKIKLDTYFSWMVIFSESEELDKFGPGEYMIFIATDLDGTDSFWDGIYRDMIVSLSF